VTDGASLILDADVAARHLDLWALILPGCAESACPSGVAQYGKGISPSRGFTLRKKTGAQAGQLELDCKKSALFHAPRMGARILRAAKGAILHKTQPLLPPRARLRAWNRGADLARRTKSSGPEPAVIAPGNRYGRLHAHACRLTGAQLWFVCREVFLASMKGPRLEEPVEADDLLFTGTGGLGPGRRAFFPAEPKPGGTPRKGAAKKRMLGEVLGSPRKAGLLAAALHYFTAARSRKTGNNLPSKTCNNVFLPGGKWTSDAISSMRGCGRGAFQGLRHYPRPHFRQGKKLQGQVRPGKSRDIAES